MAVCFLWLLITKVQNIDGKGKAEVFANTIASVPERIPYTAGEK